MVRGSVAYGILCCLYLPEVLGQVIHGWGVGEVFIACIQPQPKTVNNKPEAKPTIHGFVMSHVITQASPMKCGTTETSLV